MSGDPFERGPHPVGVRSETWTDRPRERSLPVEIWYPADSRYHGLDLDPASQDAFAPPWAASAPGRRHRMIKQAAVRDAEWTEQRRGPLIVLIHGWGGHRRDSTYLATHLASHGYPVLAPDVLGSTYRDAESFLAGLTAPAEASAFTDLLDGIQRQRRADIPFLISTAVRRLPIRPDGVGVTGASFGGWSSIIAPALDPRVAAIVPMCPGNPDTPVAAAPGPALAPAGADRATLRVPRVWRRAVPALLLVADRDSLVPLYGQLGVLRELPTLDKAMVVLARADHGHFVDDVTAAHAWLKITARRLAGLFAPGTSNWPAIAAAIEPIGRLVDGEQARRAWRGLATAHFDRHLRADTAADTVLRAPVAALAARGIVASAIYD